MHLQTQPQRQDGTALLIAVGIALVLSLMLVGYLYLTVQERTLTVRSQAWNSAIPVAEAGVEEALTQLYYTTTNNLSTNGWALGADGRYHKTRQLTATSFYGTGIQLAASPIIWSTGYVAAPFGGDAGYIRRLVRVTVVSAASYGKGLLTRTSVSLSGGAFVDSFDSTDPAHSTGSLYDPAKATSQAVVSVNSGAAGAITMSGGSYIAGIAATGPGGTVQSSSSLGVLGGIRSDANVQFTDVAAPVFGSFSIVLPTNVTVGGTNYNYGLGTGNYVVDNVTLSGSQSLVVTGTATLYCTSTGNAVNLSGSSYFYLAPGANLTIYSAGKVNISGGGVLNGTEQAKNCFIYGLPTCTRINYSGSANFIGVIEAPEADLTLSGSESASGAFLVNSASISGAGGVHFDTSLSSSTGFTVTTWNEMPL